MSLSIWYFGEIPSPATHGGILVAPGHVVGEIRGLPLPDSQLRAPDVSDAQPPTADGTGPRRVRALVALRVLEVLREQDRPGDVMEAEDTAVTMPRRLGLSDVVERQIRTYRADMKRGVRLTDAEIRDLFRLVIRRPDSDEVFLRVGRSLGGGDLEGNWRRFVPQRAAYALARSRVRRGLKKLFGRRLGGFGRGPFSVEGRSLIFIDADPGGEACHFLSGYCEAVLEQASGRPGKVVHTLCQARGDDVCRWEGSLVDAGGADGTAAPDDATDPAV